MIEMFNSKQVGYVFIPGKNWKLSLAELASYLTARQCNFKITSISKSFFVITTEQALEPSMIDELGGFLKIGKIVSLLPLKTVEDAFVRRKNQARLEIEFDLSANFDVGQVFKMPLEKCVFGVSLYFDDSRFFRFARDMQRFLGSHFKKELACRGVKARFMGFPKGRRLAQLSHVEVLKKGLVEKSAEILFCTGKDQAFVAHTIGVHDPFEFQKRDVQRPFQRKIFSMPPRLAKIMVNLSLCLRGKVLVDCFCGVGTVLQEAVLLGARVIGVDVDRWCVNASLKNLEWLRDEYGLADVKWEVLVGDACKLTSLVGVGSVDCVVSEPDLGPALRHFPTEAYARKVVGRLKPLYCGFLGEAYKVLRSEGVLVFVSPCIKTRGGGFVRLDVDERALAVGFRRVYPFEKGFFVEDNPLIEELVKTSFFVDVEKRHRVGRVIHVFRK